MGALTVAALLMLVGSGCGGGQKENEASHRGESGDRSGDAGGPGASVAEMLADNSPSLPLTAPLFRQISLEEHTFRFGPGVSGCKLVDSDRIAVERVRFSLSSDPTRVWTIAQMDSLSGAGAISSETSSFPVFSRALVRGDSAAVAAMLGKEGGIHWHEVPRDEHYSPRGIHKKFADNVKKNLENHLHGDQESGGHDDH